MALTKQHQFEQEPTMTDTNDTVTMPLNLNTATNPYAETDTMNAIIQTEAQAIAASVTAPLRAVAVQNDAHLRAKAFKKEVEEMRGAADFSYGNFRHVFKANNGEIAESGGDKHSLGRWAKVRLLAWDEHFEVSPGDSSSQNSKDFVAYSKDGKTIDTVTGSDQQAWVGRAVNDYVQYLRQDMGYGAAKARRFIDTSCALLACETAGGPVGKVVQFTLSETSISAFTSYQQELEGQAKCAAMGLPGFALPEDPLTFFFVRELASKGNNRWTKLRIETSMPTKL